MTVLDDFPRRDARDIADHQRAERSFGADRGGRSDVMAFLLGGVVIAGGLLAFLFYDNGTMSQRDFPTGSIARHEMAPMVPSITVPASPSRP